MSDQVKCSRRGQPGQPLVISARSCGVAWAAAHSGNETALATSAAECLGCSIGKKYYEPPTAPAPAEKNEGPDGMIACPDCGRLCKPTGLGRHRVAHRLVEIAPPAKPISAAPSASPMPPPIKRKRITGSALIGDLLREYPGLGAAILAELSGSTIEDLDDGIQAAIRRGVKHETA